MMLVIFVAALWALSYFAHRVLRAEMERLLGERQLSAASMIAEQVERELAHRLDTLKAVASRSGPAMLAGPSAMQFFLQEHQDLQILFSDGAFATATDGTAVAAIPGASERAGANYGDTDWLLGALRDGKATIGRPTIGKNSSGPVGVMAAPIRNAQGQIIGALSGATRLGEAGFIDQLTLGRYGKGGGFLLVAPQQRLIVAASDQARVLETLARPGANALIDRFVAGDEGFGVAADPMGVDVLYSVRSIPLTGWRVIAYLPTVDAFVPIRDLQQRLWLAALVLTLLAGGLVWWGLRRQLSPWQLTATTLATLRGRGLPWRRLPVARADEIGQWIGAFNGLIDTLEKRESAFRECEESFRRIVENSGDAILFSSTHGRIESANPAACRLFGRRAEELCELGYAGIVDATDPRLADAFRQRARTGRFHGELRAIGHGGKVLHVEVDSNVLTDSRKNRRSLDLLRDITEGKCSQDAIRLSEARLRRAELGAKSGNWELHLDSGTVIGSEGAMRLAGLDSLRWDEATIREIVLPEYLQAHDTALRQLIENGIPYDIELKIRTADRGEIKDIHSIAQFDVEKRIVFGIVQDIVAHKQNEARLQLAANVFTHVREGITVTDADGLIVEANDAFTQISGFSRADVIGQNHRILKSERQAPEFYQSMWQTLAEQGYWSGEVWNRHKSGDLYLERLTISVVRDAAGKAQNFVGLFSDITHQKALQKELERVTHYDSLTNLPNRALLAEQLQQAIAHCHRNGQSLAVCYLDLDDFKAVNDQYGHGRGDELLVAVAQRMRDALRNGDTLARIGGDEFVAVLADLEGAHACQPALERLLRAVTAPASVGEASIQVSASIGVTLYPQDGADADLLLRHADQALYVAKQSGKNRYHLFDVVQDAAASTQHEELQRLGIALERHELVLYFQPKVNMRSGEVIGAEALIRWQHPERGLLSPAAFLPMTENHQLAVDIGEWVIATALTQIESWHELGIGVPISINVGAYQLQQVDFVDRLRRMLDAHPAVRPGELSMEVLESSALDDLVGVSKVIKDCRNLGVDFALDDFGTGYSSLTYLKRLPVAMLKIDQSFVRDMLSDPDDLAILEGIISLASAFRCKVIAEGVETVEQGEMLLELGCELAQGYGIARPMPAADFPGWARTWRPDVAWTKRSPIALDDLPLLFASVEHRAWVVAMNDYLLDDSSTALPLAIEQSRFFVWLKTKGQARYADQRDFKTVESLYEQTRALVALLCELRDQGRRPEVVNRLGELHRLNDALLCVLKSLQGKSS